MVSLAVRVIIALLVTWFVVFFVGTIFVSIFGSPGEIGIVKTLIGIFLFVFVFKAIGGFKSLKGRLGQSRR